MRTLFLQAPTFDGFDGGAGSRYQAKREIKSFWYPTWLAQPASLVENSKLVDAPPHDQSLGDVVAMAKDFDLAILHTSVPSFASDVKTIEALKAANPNLKAGLIGAKVAVDAAGSLASAPVVDFVARNEFDFTVKEVADGMDWKAIRGLSFRMHSYVSAALTAAALSVVITPASAQDTTGVGTVSGVVLDAAGRPAPAVRVCVLDTPSCATTDARGLFRIGELRAGGYRLEILPTEGLPFTSDEVDVRAGLEGTVEITLPSVEDFQQTVTVAATTFQVPEAVKTSGFLVEPREILKSAGGLQDVSRYVQGLPGVVIGTNDFRNDIIVRGGSPLENLFLVDNVEIPNINAFANFASAGGTVSLLDAELLQDVTFLTGGYPAPYINRTSSVLQVTQREGNRRMFGGWATLGFGGAGAILEGPIQSGKGSWVVSARRSFLDLFTNDVGIGGVPVLYSFNAKAVYDLTPRDRIWLVNIAGIDEIRLGLTESTNLEDEIANFDIRYDGWRSATGVNWQRTFGSSGVGLFGVSHSEAKVGQQVKDLVAQGAPPAGVPPEVVIARSPVVYAEDSREGETTIKYDLTVHLPFFDTVQTGGSFKTFRIRYEVESPYGNDTPY